MWRSHSLRVTGSPVAVEVLPAVDTRHWSPDRTDAAVEEIHALFCRHLPADQQPAA